MSLRRPDKTDTGLFDDGAGGDFFGLPEGSTVTGSSTAASRGFGDA